MKAECVLLLALCTEPVLAQRPMRRHTANESQPLRTVPADKPPPVESEAEFRVNGQRVVIANGMPDHKLGSFPNRGNPHAIEAQEYRFELQTEPKANRDAQYLHRAGHDLGGGANTPFGIAVNGVMIDPGTAEFWNGDRYSGWNYCALGCAVPLGLDENHAHVQPTGAYHYHGLPTGLLASLDLKPGEHSPLVGWAADGYPVYALYGCDGKNAKKVIKHTSSYRLKKGTRPAPPDGPGGKYDGAFVQDYEFAEGAGTLDECNGCFTVTPEFPQGTYAYFMTENWPVIPCAFRADPIRLREGHPHGMPPRRDRR